MIKKYDKKYGGKKYDTKIWYKCKLQKGRFEAQSVQKLLLANFCRVATCGRGLARDARDARAADEKRRWPRPPALEWKMDSSPGASKAPGTFQENVSRKWWNGYQYVLSMHQSKGTFHQKSWHSMGLQTAAMAQLVQSTTLWKPLAWSSPVRPARGQVKPEFYPAWSVLHSHHSDSMQAIIPSPLPLSSPNQGIFSRIFHVGGKGLGPRST